jgi:hypothetical protein
MQRTYAVENEFEEITPENLEDVVKVYLQRKSQRGTLLSSDEIESVKRLVHMILFSTDDPFEESEDDGE